MAHDYSISDFGLKLIKAYEGFRAVETVLVSGQRVIGYGHEYEPGESPVVTKKKAAEILKKDLEPFEDLVNHNIFAPLSQGQFDALVSLSFNIGAEAFLNSSVVHNLNNGQPLAAAAGFDEWRKSVIVDQTYVVDALVRRRTAEKALFLRPATGVVAAPRNEIPPLQDSAARSGSDDVEIFDKSRASGYVDQTPYETEAIPRRRREDGPSGILTLSERVPEPPIYEDTVGESPDFVEPVEEHIEENAEPEAKRDENLSQIAIAAAEVSERLDNLMEDKVEPLQEETVDPDLVYEGNGTISEDVDIVSEDVDIANDQESAEAAPRESTLEMLAANIIQDNVEQDVQARGDIGAYWTALIVGLALLGGGLWKLKFSTAQLDEISAFLAPVAMLVGAMMIIGGMYYLLKAQMRRMSE